jgi:hypothetical protein
MKSYTCIMLHIAALFALSPLMAANNFIVNIVNNTASPTTKVYILVKGLNPNTKKQTFIKFTPGNPVGEYADVTTPDKDVHNPTQSIEYGYDYTMFKDAQGHYALHLPYLESGRIYISLDNQLRMPVVGTAPNLGIADPSPFNKSDPSYQYLYDKVEFTYLSNGVTVINPTAVDCLSLPITVTQKKMVNNKEETVVYGIEHSREQTFKDINAILTAAGNSPEWTRLIIKKADGTILRIVAPGRDDAFFNPNYLNDYITALWTYYKTHDLSIDCSELTNLVPGLGSYIFVGRINDHDEFEFKNQPEAGKTPTVVTIGKPASRNFFLADQGPFQAPNNTVQAVLVRNICSAWSVGLLPTTSMLNRDYYMAEKAAHAFYKDNAIILTTGTHKPWYNLYAKAIHQVSKDIYAWAYDDAIGLDGTNFSTDAYPATLTVGPLTNASASPKIKKFQSK